MNSVIPRWWALFVGHLSGSKKIMRETIGTCWKRKKNTFYFVKNLKVTDMKNYADSFLEAFSALTEHKEDSHFERPLGRCTSLSEHLSASGKKDYESHSLLQTQSLQKLVCFNEIYFHCVHACSVAQACSVLCDPIDCSPPGSSVHGIPQARILQWIAMPFSWGSCQPRDGACISCISCIDRRVLYH